MKTILASEINGYFEKGDIITLKEIEVIFF